MKFHSWCFLPVYSFISCTDSVKIQLTGPLLDGVGVKGWRIELTIFVFYVSSRKLYGLW